MSELASELGILELHFKHARRNDAAMHSKRTAKHCRPSFKGRPTAIEPNELLGSAHRVHWAFLIKAPCFSHAYKRPKNYLVPVRRYLVITPSPRTHGLRTHLLRKRHSNCLSLAIGMV